MAKSITIFLFSLLVCSVLPFESFSQSGDMLLSKLNSHDIAYLQMQSDSLSRDTTRLQNSPNDSTFKPLPKDQTIGDNNNVMTKDPTTAMLWSIIPGGGQFYNESYLKGGLFVISAGVLTGLTVYNYSKFFPLQDSYDNNVAILNTLPEDDPLRNEIEQENRTLITRKENFRDNAHLSVFLLGISYFVATMDAYVGAHLYDFDVEDEIGMMLLPSPLGGANLVVTYRF